MKKHRLPGCLIILLFLLATGNASGTSPRTGADSTWVDSVFQSLTPDQRIAQLFIIRAYSDKDSTYNDSIANMIRKWNPGGICFFKGTPWRQACMTNSLQSLAQTPLLISTDAEYGIGMRLDSAVAFPREMTLGALQDDSLIWVEGTLIARDCKRMGVQMNFAPVADINNNPGNPVIGFRSFGENRDEVTRRSIIFMKGLQSGGILTTAKHFPGHGDTDTDSHLALPVIRHSEERLDSIELYPFSQLIRNGVDGIMIAHLYIPSIDSTKDTPTTLSRKVVSELLKEKMGFKGFVVTDALDMKGVTKYFKPGEIEVKALLAGNDLLLLPKNLDAAVNGIRMARDSALIPEEMIDSQCLKVLRLKYRAGLADVKPVQIKNLYEDLNPLNSKVLTRAVFRNAITLVRNENQLLPLNFLDRRKIAVLFIGDTVLQPFQEMISQYTPARFFVLPASFSQKRADSLIAEMRDDNLIIIALHCNQGLVSKQYGIQDCALRLIDTLSTLKKVILDIFGSPYALAFLKNPMNIETILESYQDVPEAQELSAEMIFGGIAANGQLPVTAAPGFPLKTGLSTQVTRLEFVLPEEIGIHSEKLKVIDSIAQRGIDQKAFPGCQVLFAKDGKVFYQKSFGHPRYEDTVSVKNNDIYDLASVTKVAATTLAIMKLYEAGKISPDDKLGKYLPWLEGSNKNELVIRDVMTHQAGLQSWIPFYRQTLRNSQPDPAIYQKSPSDRFPFRVADSLYIRSDYIDTICHLIALSPLRSTHDYKYSDMGFYLLRFIIEKITGKPLEDYLAETFYRPLGLTTMGFRPRDRFPLSRIMPTEYDTIFRKQLLHGDVHDPGAAMLGGVSGHAGLFSDAADLAVLLQLFLNHGEYGSKQYFLPSTVKEFTRVQFPASGNRRALGFDKPTLNYNPDGPSCKSASPLSFGHSGFTGTYIWADPENNLVYVFLSNRVYPDASNEKIVEMNIRTSIHQAMYEILEKTYGKK
ncbi:MAG: serine hydrolase [Bacteroidetes bacterium]|nr:serine hydrolase [Bacteroidota bacterium]